MQLYGIPPFSNVGACQVMEELLSHSRISLITEPPGLESHWKRLAVRHTPSPKLWMDAYLAAFALVGNHRLVTGDKAFTQFKDLNPIILA